MSTYIDVFHVQMGLRVVGTRDSALVVAVQWRRVLLQKSKFFEEGT
jgi:hypothetical protein